MSNSKKPATGNAAKAKKTPKLTNAAKAEIKVWFETNYGNDFEHVVRNFKEMSETNLRIMASIMKYEALDAAGELTDIQAVYAANAWNKLAIRNPSRIYKELKQSLASPYTKMYVTQALGGNAKNFPEFKAFAAKLPKGKPMFSYYDGLRTLRAFNVKGARRARKQSQDAATERKELLQAAA